MGISMPLLEKVPPNDWYGFRVPKTFLNERIWYAANRAAGYDLLWTGVAITLTSGITGLVHRIGSATANTINIIVFMVAIVVAVAHSFLTLNRL